MSPLMQAKAALAVLAIGVLCVGLLSVRACTRAGAVEDVSAKVQKQQISVTGQAIEISNKTEMRVQVEQFETTKATQARLEKIDEKIAAQPVVPRDPFGVVLVNDSDLDDVMRIVQDAEAAAARAACRVQRTSDCAAVAEGTPKR
ncbi:hypothetical protein [Stenotrophomonas phage BUCT555]|nr:hypothetical protein [Stenotrophomonas phage BUCT555]